ncbi:MAG: hypothetical protein MR965_04270 [Lachnospiraceae bacterium]|nr:hypothetical protein [Lachnospiraceae bacterium]
MKVLLENYNILFILMGVCALSVVLKAASYGLYHKLLWDSNQMGTTGNRWMKAMMSKFEAYYKLHISIHNVENFVDRYLYHYRFMGISLQAWENIGYYFSGVIVAGAGLGCFLAGYYGMPAEWFWITGLVSLLLLCVQAASELFFDTHKCLRVLRIQLIDYMENTMRARLENEYFNQEAVEKYQMEYFQSDGKNSEKTAEPKEKMPALLEIKELLESFHEEMQLDRDIAGRQSALAEQTAAEKARLFEEILEEYM